MRKRPKGCAVEDYDPPLRGYVEKLRPLVELVSTQQMWFDGLKFCTNYSENLGYIRQYLDEWSNSIEDCANGKLRHDDLYDEFRFGWEDFADWLRSAPVVAGIDKKSRKPTRGTIDTHEVNELFYRLHAPIRKQGFELIDRLLGTE